MGATKDHALIVQTRKNYNKKENHHHNKKKENKQNNFIKNHSRIRCYTCYEKGHFIRDHPNRKKRHHAHTAKDDEPTTKIFRREKDDSNEEYALIL